MGKVTSIDKKKRAKKKIRVAEVDKIVTMIAKEMLPEEWVDQACFDLTIACTGLAEIIDFERVNEKVIRQYFNRWLFFNEQRKGKS